MELGAMHIFQDINGQGLTKTEWLTKSHSDEWTLKQYSNGKLMVRLEWIGRYDKKLPSEYRHSHGVMVFNRLKVRESEWVDEGTLTDRGWVLDPAATQTFRTKAEAEAAYEDLLVNFTQSYLDEDENGDVVLEEEGNDLAPAKPGALVIDEDVIKAAEAKGVALGGWS